MNGEIIDKDETDFGVEVVDNSGVEHRIVMGFDGKINGYKNDGYPPKPAERTRTEQETVFHARRYARYYVAQETGHQTLPWDLNPDRFETVRETLAGLSTADIERFFGDLFAQSLSHFADDPAVEIGDIARPHELPAEMIGGDDTALYKQEIYLDADDDIEATSGVIISYYVARGEKETVRHGTAPDREPDAIVEVSPTPFVDPGPFRDYLVYNLRCQIRDCYLMMGLEPPEAYKVLGHGQYRFTGKYQHFEIYPRYYDMNAEIPGYSHEFRPDLPLSWEEVGGLFDPAADDSLYDQLKSALFSR